MVKPLPKKIRFPISKTGQFVAGAVGLRDAARRIGDQPGLTEELRLELRSHFVARGEQNRGADECPDDGQRSEELAAQRRAQSRWVHGQRLAPMSGGTQGAEGSP